MSGIKGTAPFGPIDSGVGVAVSIKSPLESNGAVPVNIQDQHTRILDLKFIQAQGAPTALTVETAEGDKTITVANAAGFVAGNVIGIFCPCGDFYFGQQIGAPAAGVIALDTPIDVVYELGSSVITAIKNMNVNGSGTTEIFQIGPVGGATGVEIDITRIAGYIQDGSAMDDSLFGALGALANGIVLRKNNGVMQNIWNAKTNGELAEICTIDFNYTDRAPSGSFGARFRNTFAGQTKHGVTIRLEAGDILELLIQDNLTGLEAFTVTAQGHVVTD